MQLRLKLTPDALLIYRKKGGVLVFLFILCVASLMFSAAYFWLMMRQATTPSLVAIVIGLVFALVGFFGLFQLTRVARKMTKEDGTQVLLADASGLTVSLGIGAESKHFAWSSIAEVVLAEKFQVIEAYETSSSSRVIVVFLSGELFDAANWLIRLSLGIDKSGTGRPYVLANYPRGEGQTVEAALGKIAPSAAQIHLVSVVAFDLKTSDDTYTEASFSRA